MQSFLLHGLLKLKPQNPEGRKEWLLKKFLTNKQSPGRNDQTSPFRGRRDLYENSISRSRKMCNRQQAFDHVEKWKETAA